MRPESAGKSYEIEQSDVLSLLTTLTDASIDLIVTDPPYESLEKHRSKGTTTRLKVSKASSNEWFPIIKNGDFPAIFEHFYRVLKPNTHFYLMCDPESTFVFKPMAEAAGFNWRNTLIWDKLSMGMGYAYRRSYEPTMLFEKGKRKLNDLGVKDVISAQRIRNGFPTEKPLELIECFVEQSSAKGEVVLDPFMGSGVCGHACIKTGRYFVGGDVIERAFTWASERLAEAERYADANASAIRKDWYVEK